MSGLVNGVASMIIQERLRAVRMRSICARLSCRWGREMT